MQALQRGAGQERLSAGRGEHRLYERRAVDALVQAAVRAGAQRGRHQVVVARFGQTQHRSVAGLDEPTGQLDAVGLPVVAEAKARDHHVGVDDLLQVGRLGGPAASPTTSMFRPA